MKKITDVRGVEIEKGDTVYSSALNKTYEVIENTDGKLCVSFQTQIGICTMIPEDWNDFHVLKK